MHQPQWRTWFLRSSVLIVALIICVVALQANWKEAGVAFQGDQDKDKEVRSFLQSVGAAFNRHDAKAVADSFLPEGELVDENGNVIRTRAALEDHYAEIFKTKPQSHMKVANETLRLIGDSLAMFDGIAEVKSSPREALRRSRFAAVLSKQGNDWRIASIRDLEDDENDPAVIREKLDSLSFLVGEWLEEDGLSAFRRIASGVRTSCL
jgi:uncharacterized protein (TIGR02246 family)